MSDIQSFRDAIEAFISARGWTPTRFGRQMAGDPLFVFDLREGREPRSETRQRILKAMQDAAEAPAAPPLRIGVAGLGNVGATLVRILQRDGGELTRKIGRPVVVTAVSARSARATAASTPPRSNGSTIPSLSPNPMASTCSSS